MSQTFIDTLAPSATALGSQYGIYASVMIAQACLESDWGQSDLALPPNHNLFGIKGRYNGQYVVMKTWEDDGTGQVYWIDAEFRKYPSYYESMEDNAKLIRYGLDWDPNYYSGAWKENAATYQAATQWLQGRYATDTLYASKLNNLIEQWDLTQYDSGEVVYTYPGLPVKAGTPITDVYGNRNNPVTGEPELHNGQDWGGALNDPIYASMAGTVTYVGFNEYRGHHVIIKHSSEQIYTKYLHLNAYHVAIGQVVTKGETIGLMGTTGQSTGVHLHFTVTTSPEGTLDGGQYIDPAIYLATPVKDGGGQTPTPRHRNTPERFASVSDQELYTYAKETYKQMRLYKVKAGDTLGAIATANNTTIANIRRFEPNAIANPNLLNVGDILAIPEPQVPVYHIVKAGDTLTEIAKRYDATPRGLVNANKLKNPNHIEVGQKLLVAYK